MDFDVFWEPIWEGKSIQDRSKLDPKGHQKNERKKRASWKRLGGVFGAPKPTGAAGRGWTRLHAGAVAETQGPLLGRIPKDLDYKKGYIKEVRKDRRLKYGTPYAMRRRKAWRGGSRHRAYL